MRQREIFWISFPYSDLVHEKHRPVLVLSNNAYNKDGEDVLACSVTSNLQARPYSIALSDKDFEEGDLPLKSRVRCDKIFSLEKNIFTKKMARLNEKTFAQVGKQIIELLSTKEK